MAAQEAFADGVAVITGAGSGIGEGLARYAAELGMKVVLADVAPERIARVAADIEARGGKALAVATDVTDSKAIERLADAAYSAFGEVRLLVNNAGIEVIGFTWEIPGETWDRALAVNISGVVHGARVFAPRMIESKRQSYIANVSSIGAVGMMPTQAPYMMSKHAVLSFSECLFLEMQLAGAPIHVSAVLPAQVRTRIFEDAPTDRSSQFVERQRVMMHGMLEQTGLTPAQAAERILAGVAAKEFWVSTHPDITQHMARARAAYLSEQDWPRLAEEARALVE